MPGLVPNRGRWTYDRFATGSSVTFKQGSLVQFAGDRTLSEYSGGEPNFLGIALHNSTDSLPTGFVTVAIPTNGECTAWADVPSGLANSAFSLGESVGITKSGNTVSMITTGFTSSASRCAVIRGLPVLSPVSRVEIAFITDMATYNSSISQTI